MQNNRNTRLFRLAGVFEDLSAIDTLIPFGKMLRAMIGNSAINTGDNFQADIRIGFYLDTGAQQMIVCQRNKPLEGKADIFAVTGVQRDFAGQLTVFEVEGTAVIRRIAFRQRKTGTVYPNIHPGQIGKVRQLGNLIIIKFIEGTGHKQPSGLADIAFLKGGTLTDIPVAQRKNSFAFAEVTGIKRTFFYQPVFQRAGTFVILHQFHSVKLLSDIRNINLHFPVIATPPARRSLY